MNYFYPPHQKRKSSIMSRIITFSTKFPKGHPAEGRPTFFVEKIWESIYMDYSGSSEFAALDKTIFDILPHEKYVPKQHTIRRGKRWKVGDKFSPRIWNGRPYNSKQIVIAPDIEIKKVWDFKTTDEDYILNGKKLGLAALTEVAKNDGLNVDDFECWFPKIFAGQIICWNEEITY